LESGQCLLFQREMYEWYTVAQIEDSSIVL
jgi:hypothetical protein